MHLPAAQRRTKVVATGHSAVSASTGVTDCGRVRRANEDAFVMLPEDGIFVVCDGMGGAAAGEVASRLAADTAAASIAESDFGPAAMRQAVQRANSAVYQRACQDHRMEGMGTTLVALAVGESSVCVAHVGDSRCYRWRGGVLQRLTNDHSLVEEQIRVGRMTREQARRSPMQNVITRAIGTRTDVVPDIEELTFEDGDIFLLASDGLTRELSDAALSAILASDGNDLESVCARMVAGANAAGGRDNITCVLLRTDR